MSYAHHLPYAAMPKKRIHRTRPPEVNHQTSLHRRLFPRTTASRMRMHHLPTGCSAQQAQEQHPMLPRFLATEADIRPLQDPNFARVPEQYWICLLPPTPASAAQRAGAARRATETWCPIGLTHLICAEIFTAAQIFSRQQTSWHISWGYISRLRNISTQSRVFALISSPGAARSLCYPPSAQKQSQQRSDTSLQDAAGIR